MEEKMIEMFHAMWGNFPARARLINKNREVLAVNKFAEKEGLQPGVRCIDQPPLEGHRGCLANAALKDGQGKRRVKDGKVIFWVPLEGYADVYVHGSVYINE